jgi:putative membrane protein
MTLFMEAARPLLHPAHREPLPPRRVTERAAAKVDLHDDMTEGQKKAATGVAHFAYGAGAGAVYGALSPLLPFDPVLNGVAYGLGVWTGSYLGLMPALGLHPSATDEPAGRNALMIGAHLVWGAALGLLTEQFVGQHGQRSPTDELDRRHQTPANVALTSAQL